MQTDPWVILGIRLGLTKPPGTADAAEDGG
jgi:hypothetical protein